MAALPDANTKDSQSSSALPFPGAASTESQVSASELSIRLPHPLDVEKVDGQFSSPGLPPSSALSDEEALVADNKLRVLKLNGWGYLDTWLYTPFHEDHRFPQSKARPPVIGTDGEVIRIDEEDVQGDALEEEERMVRTSGIGNESRIIVIRGNRYWFCGKIIRGYDFLAKFKGFTHRRTTPAQEIIKVPKIQTLNNDFVAHLSSLGSIRYSFAGADRLHHCHGHTVEEMFTLRYSSFRRVPDMIIYPKNHQEVCEVVRLACLYNVVIIPYGGGTSVTLALNCPENEKRMIVSCDVSSINQVFSIDSANLVARVGAGAVGVCLESHLKSKGYTLGHEPDSSAFSTLGGWISTRCSGMKKNTYGNIEDIVLSVTTVTPKGVLITPNVCNPSFNVETMSTNGNIPSNYNTTSVLPLSSITETPSFSSCPPTRLNIEGSKHYPRVSGGPSLKDLVLGSEGILGIITEAVIKIRPLPEEKRYGGMVFPTFEHGVNFMREVTKQRVQPTSIRLMDSLQFQFGSAMRPFEILRTSDGGGTSNNNNSKSKNNNNNHSNINDDDINRNNSTNSSNITSSSNNGSSGSSTSSSRRDSISSLFDGSLLTLISDRKDHMIEGIKKYYLFNVKGFDPQKMVACTILMEGSKEQVCQNERQLYRICKQYQGLPGGSRLGKQGYNLTFMIAYIRDFIMNYNWIFESFETSLPWDAVIKTYHRVRERVEGDCERLNIVVPPVFMARVAQVYDEGAVLYFYLGFNWKGLTNPMKTYGIIEDSAREVIMQCGGCISHHHGVGKLRKKFMRQHAGSLGLSLLKSVKDSLDPKNIFGAGNIL